MEDGDGLRKMGDLLELPPLFLLYAMFVLNFVIRRRCV